MTPPTTVVHCKVAPYDIYVGRGTDPRTGRVPEINFGNPFTHIPGVPGTIQVASVAEAVREYEQYARERPWYVALIKAHCRGKVLGCWCHGTPCHGQVIAQIADEPDNPSTP